MVYRICMILMTMVAASAVHASVIITDDIDEGIESFKVVTPTATYYYDKAGAGFTSMLDQDGIDWINFHPPGTPGVDDGASGWYRGIPNMAPTFGHPGYTGANSITPDEKGVPLPKATIHSTKEEWSVTWEFLPTYAQMIVHSVKEDYWLLYEGTPGGANGSADTCWIWRSSGAGDRCSVSWEQDIINNSGAAIGGEWVYFTDERVDRSLFLIHDDDDITDLYYWMDAMTVAGFGRERPSMMSRLLRKLGIGGPHPRLLSSTPAILIVGFAESREFDAVKARIDEIYHRAMGR